MMKIADKDKDAKISREELYYAMQSWYGYTHLSAEFGQLFEKYDVDQSNNLDAVELQNMLTELNAKIPVPLSQAEQVLKNADVLGDGKVGRFELLGAVGSWYVAVGREPTPEMFVAMRGLKEQKKLSMAQVFASIICGALTFYIGYTYNDRLCSRPLAMLMMLSGSFSLAQVVFQIVMFKLSTKRAWHHLLILVGILLLLSVVAAQIVGILGIIFTFQTSETDCDPALHKVAWIMFILPLFVGLFLMVCLICCAFVAMALHRKNDGAVQQMVDTGSGTYRGETEPLVYNRVE
jgi:uncharacterized membrane protein YidH (DUF202 family)